MGKKKKYILNFCNDCGIDFLTALKLYDGKYDPAARTKEWHCPHCRLSSSVTFERFIWIDKFINQKQPWTDWEDQAIIYGRNRGQTWAEIAEALDRRTPQAARRRGERLREEGLLVK